MRTAQPPAPLPRPLDRRFEAFLFDWDGTAVPDRKSDATEMRRLIEALCALGAEVAVTSGTHVGNVDGQLQARPTGPGSLHLLLNRGSEVFRVDAGGPHLVWRRECSPAEEAALDAAAAATRASFGERGLESQLVSSRLNRRKLDVIPLPEWEDPPKARIEQLLAAVEARLATYGVGSLVEAVGIAKEAARGAGLDDPRVTSDAKHVEIGLTDKADSARWFFSYLWNRGIGPELVLIIGDEMGPLGGSAGSDYLLLVDEASRATAVSVGVEPEGVSPRVLRLPGGPPAFERLLRDQLRRRVEGEVPGLQADPDWAVRVEGIDRVLERAHESLLTLADGRYGTAGVPPLEHELAEPRVLVADAYTPGGPETDLLQAPIWNRLQGSMPEGAGLERELDLHSGLLHQELRVGERPVRIVQFSSLDSPGTAVMRAAWLPRGAASGRALLAPHQGFTVEEGLCEQRSWVSVRAGQAEVAAVVRDDHEGERESLDRVVAYVRSTADIEAAARRLDTMGPGFFDALLSRHRAAWAARWETADVEIDGDRRLTQAVRFALFHLMSAVSDRDEAAVGARGLSGPGYRGHVFWDSDVFVLPFLAASHPASARAMLEYRVRRLPAARSAARAAGRAGARFPWESAASGHEASPPTLRDYRGRVVPIRTGLLEEHVVADVAWAVRCYLDWSGDDEFQRGAGADLLTETARYWASRIRVGGDGRGHIYGVMGPDEYHEAVDDDAYTNVMARWNLREAVRAVAKGYEGANPDETARWAGLADSLVDGYDPASGLYEQFAGFYDLEPLLIRDAAPRRPIAADVLLGRDRTAGAQVVKQAAVLMLHHLVPAEVAPGSLRPNLEYYEPRTAHGSSLSPGIHAALFARARMLDEAVRWLRVASRIDLDDVTETTARGLHMAAMGSVWQALVMGFAGVRPTESGLEIRPHVPADWRRLRLHVCYRGNPIRIQATPSHVIVDAAEPVTVVLPDGVRRLSAGVSRLPISA